MEKPLVSIIIPVYHSRPYLEECLSSLRSQTLRDIEMIFVDDAGGDGSLEYLEEASREDFRIRVISFPENRGVSVARNAGIEAAAGAYIGFCDADDWVEPQMFEKLLSACLEKDADISFCRVFKDRGERSENVPLGFDNGTVFERDAIRETLIPAMLALPRDGNEIPLSGYTPRNLFRREVLGEERFRPDIRYAEDLLFIVSCLLQAGKAVAVDEAYYHYRFHAGSVTKRYSPYVPESFDRSNEALAGLLSSYPECMRRMNIRRRKMAVDAVRNYCMQGSPYGPLKRLHVVREYMKRADVRDAFKGLELRSLSLRAGIRLGLVKYRLAILSCLLFSTIFQSRM